MRRHRVEFVRSVHRTADLLPGGLPEICVSGRSNVGKSSLLNRLAGTQGLAKVSSRPGKTQSLNYFQVDDAFYLVDLPGYGFAHASRAQRETFGRLADGYLSNRTELAGVVQLIDSRHGPVSGDVAMLEWLEAWSGDVLYVLTKADKLSAQQRSMAMNLVTKEFGVENSMLFSAVTGTGTEAIWRWMFETVAEFRSKR